jgi:radical SAM superfamily enzyme YgiQ (UPF0313 family)
MKILLIYPPRKHHMFGETPYLYIEADAGIYPPIGLFYIAGYLKKYSDHEVYILDAHAENFSHQKVKEYVSNLKPEIVGIYFTTYYLYDSIIIARNVKNISKDIIIVAGGPHVVLYPNETIQIPEIDYVVVGEGEKSFTKLVNLLSKRNLSLINQMPEVLTKEDVNKIPIRAKIDNLDDLPFPARELTDYKKYCSILAKKNPITTMITSRGCPYRCYFCSNIESGQKVRYRSAKNVVDEIEEIVDKFGVQNILFFDELFTSNRRRVIEICDEIISRGLKIYWHCRSRADVLDEEMVKKMRKAGCRFIQFGIETGSQRLQKVINKNLNLEKVKEIIKMVYDNGIYTYADFMVGLPTETEEEMKQTLEFAKSLKLDYAVFGMFHPDFGSVFYEQGLRQGIFEDYWYSFVKNYGQISIADHSWTRKDKEKYHNIVSDYFKKFYLRETYLIQHLFRIDSLKQAVWQIKSALKIFFKLFKQKFYK